MCAPFKIAVVIAAALPHSRFSAGHACRFPPSAQPMNFFLEGAHHQRIAQASQLRQPPEYLEILLIVLTKADAGIEEKFRFRDARSARIGNRRAQALHDIVDHVARERPLMHGPG